MGSVYFIGRDNKIHYRRVKSMSVNENGEVIYLFADGCVKDIGIPEKYISYNHEDLRGIK